MLTALQEMINDQLDENNAEADSIDIEALIGNLNK